MRLEDYHNWWVSEGLENGSHDVHESIIIDPSGVTEKNHQKSVIIVKDQT